MQGMVFDVEIDKKNAHMNIDRDERWEAWKRNSKSEWH